MGAAVKDFYERYWREGRNTVNVFEEWKLGEVKRLVDAAGGGRVLDVGCGDGRVLAAVARERGIGVDMAFSAARAAAATGVTGVVAQLDGVPLPLRDGSCDVALCLDVLEHVFDPEHLLREMSRALRPGGTLVVTVPNAFNLFNRLTYLMGRHVDIMDKAHVDGETFSEHIRFFSKEVLERVLAGAGFRVAARRHYFPRRFREGGFRAVAPAALLVSGPRLHDLWPSLFSLEFLYACRKEVKA